MRPALLHRAPLRSSPTADFDDVRRFSVPFRSFSMGFEAVLGLKRLENDSKTTANGHVFRHSNTWLSPSSRALCKSRPGTSCHASSRLLRHMKTIREALKPFKTSLLSHEMTSKQS